ncbi:MAG: energy transducer TonB [Bacteroidota bacterium]
MSIHHDPVTYRIRGLAALAASLALVCAVFTFWPKALLAPAATPVYDVSAPEVVALEEIAQTVQAPPPPPPPPTLLPPVEVPDDVEIPDEEFDFEEPTFDLPTEITIPDAPAREATPAPAPAAPALVERPQRSPVHLTLSTPTYPDEARRAGIRARVRVKVLVNESGQVAEAEVVERLLLRGDEERTVDAIGYGVEAAALDAARRERFRPARHDGARVRAYTTTTYSFGV